jgi:hypothetical protein
MMHMFLVKDPDLSSFAHVHPTRTDANSFRVAFPPLPAGRYRIYADIAHEDGASQTLVAMVDAPADPAPAVVATATPVPNDRDPDDASWTGTADAATTATLPGGLIMRWINASAPLVAGRDGEMMFAVTDSLGTPVRIEPYMGMRGHAMLTRTDGQVFMHLHPAGTISLAAQEALSRAQSSGGSAHEAMTEAPAVDEAGAGTVRFPLVVPRSGRYRLWVQVKFEGEVRTAAFDTEVR